MLRVVLEIMDTKSLSKIVAELRITNTGAMGDGTHGYRCELKDGGDVGWNVAHQRSKGAVALLKTALEAMP